MKSDFLIAITQLSAEKNLPKEVVFGAVEAALVSAFKKEVGAANQNIAVKIHPTTGEIKVYLQKTVAETVSDPNKEMTLAEAQKVKRGAQLGEVVEVETTSFQRAGRIAAQTAKQVVLQRLREAEREFVYEEYADKKEDIVSGIVQRIEPKQIIIDLGKAEAVLPASEQVRSEHYRVGQRIKVFLMEVSRTNKGPQLIVSRTHRNLLRRLFELEVPEIFNGVVELKSIAREAGFRSKVAVAARQEGIDPVGSCVGMRGIRIQNIVNELNGEKIDVVQWHADPAVFIANALSPAQVLSVEVNEEDKSARVVVPDRQLSLAIGREGQNVRLAAKLSGWHIDIKSATEAEAEMAAREAERAALEAERNAALEEAEAALKEAPPAEASVEAAPSAEAPQPVVEAPPQEMPAPAPAAAEPEAIEEVQLPVAEPALAEIAAPAEAEVAAPPEPAVTPVPEPTPVMRKPKIRFAEELLVSREGRATGKARKGKRGEVRKEEDVSATGKPRKARRQRGPIIEEEEIEEY